MAARQSSRMTKRKTDDLIKDQIRVKTTQKCDSLKLEKKEKRKYTKRLKTQSEDKLASSFASSVKKEVRTESEQNEEERGTQQSADVIAQDLRSKNAIEKLRAAATSSPAFSESTSSTSVKLSIPPTTIEEKSLSSIYFKKLQEQQRITEQLQTQVNFLQNMFVQQPQVAGYLTHPTIHPQDISSQYQQPLQSFMPGQIGLVSSQPIVPVHFNYQLHSFFDPRRVMYGAFEHYPLLPLASVHSSNMMFF